MTTNSSDIGAAPSRIGPRPLALHLGLATTTVASSLAALPLHQKNSFARSTDSLALSKGPFDLESLGGGADLLQELANQGSEQVQKMIDGIRLYHIHPYRREPRHRPVIWQQGTTQLLDGAPEAATTAPVVLLVPSLINRAYILDLMPGRSLVDYLAVRGIRPLLLDWNAPGDAEREFDVAGYIINRICPAIDFAADVFSRAPLHLAGYCMGGTLSVAAARRKLDKISSFIAIASPWDFHAEFGGEAKALFDQREMWANILAGFGELPVDLLQTLFASLDPNLGLRKFRKFAEMDMATDAAQEFVAIEDWLNDGYPLAQHVAADVFDKWYGRNEPPSMRWMVDGEIVRPQDITIASLIAVPKTDKIVPRPSALALASALPSATVITPPSGHVGMMAGGKAQDGLWLQLGDWIAAH
ncbi:alpha/beta fold hydrolase [Sneathiella sp. CAU 1612]|uniref:Alpha/beta fold hydrolase n=1 Tax=Sneathiella sedimenti TaxID=2816034 RepID=A0ABS3F343_9PROT|nr:alpha/beta fold hydrolase [Sneathiella sedimenti]MBO0332890.1 alpha/beta fold hydrolase [Sneathiella sedimenti]